MVCYQPPSSDYHCEHKVESDRRDWALGFFRVVMILIACFCFYKGLPASWRNSTPKSKGIAAQPVAEQRLVTRAIQDYDVGMRALGKNPNRQQVETAPEPEPATSRKLVLRMKKDSGRNLYIKLLRSVAWIDSVGAEEGGSFHLDLPEMGAVGEAFVEAILPCPSIEQGPGNVVTATFAHEADPSQKILSVTFSNGAHIQGVTENHPVYSVNRDDFVPIGEMKEGEFVKDIHGVAKITRIDSRYPNPGEMLYNLETHNEHVYQVTTSGILVHNNCITGSIRGRTPNKIADDILGREPTWRKVPVNQGYGWKIVDDNGIERMRYMYPQKTGFPHERTGYFVRQDAKGRFLDIDGSVIPDGPLQITLRHIFDTSP